MRFYNIRKLVTCFDLEKPASNKNNNKDFLRITPVLLSFDLRTSLNSPEQPEFENPLKILTIGNPIEA